MLVRTLVPLALSSALLVFGPSAKGDLDISPPQMNVEVPEPAPEQHASVFAPSSELSHALLASRLEALDRGIPGLSR